MARAVITKQTLDQLIRAKIGDEGKCGGVHPMPVMWRMRTPDGCNWIIPGWTGDSDSVSRCTERIAEYLRVLRAQFDIPEE